MAVGPPRAVPDGVPHLGRRKPLGQSRLGKQIIGSLVFICIAFILASLGGYGAAAVRSYLVTAEHNFFPHVQEWFSTAFWMDSYDRWVFRETATEVVPAAAPLFTLPVEGEVVLPFGWRQSPVDDRQFFHSGIDIRAPEGAAVQAAASATVSRIYEDPALGQVVEMEVRPGLVVLYGNCTASGEPGTVVRQGEVIGVLDDGSRPLHFEIQENGVPVDPLAPR